MSAAGPAAGLPPAGSAEPAVTAAGPLPSTTSLAADRGADESLAVDGAHRKPQLPLAPVLAPVGRTAPLRGPGVQKRCAWPWPATVKP